MRSMTLIIFLLLTTTAFSQAVEKQTKTVVPPPPPLKSSTKIEKPAKTGVSKRLRSARSEKKRKTRTPTRRQSKLRSSAVVSKNRSNKKEATKDPVVSESKPVTNTPDVNGRTQAEPAKEQEEKPQPMKANERIPFMAEDQPETTKASTEGSVWMNVLGAIAIVLGLLFVGTWLIKKFGLFGVPNDIDSSKSDLELIASVSPRPGQTISVVNFNGENLLVGSTDQGFTLLSKQPQQLKNANVTSFPTPVPVSSLLLDSDENLFENRLEEAENNIEFGKYGGIR